jgi:hypothetical protein
MGEHIMADITYGSVVTTRHSVKHCKGKVRRTSNAIVAGNTRLGSSKNRHDYIVDEALALGAIHREHQQPKKKYAIEGQEFMVIKGRDGVYHREMIKSGELVEVKLRKKKAAVEKREACDVFKKHTFKTFKKLNEKRTSCSAKGHGNTATKDRSISIQMPASLDVDNVSGMTGMVSLACNTRHMTKVTDKTLAKERAKFQECMKQHRVNEGRDEWTPEEKKNKRLRKAALRNSAQA